MADIQVANTDADLSGNTVLTEENGYTITGLHTFSRSTNAPFACISGAAYVQYLDADKVDGVEAAALLRVDGSLALSANWDAGGYEIRSSTFESDVSTGTAPLTIASTTLVANLNADKLDSQEGTYYLAAANFTGTLAVNQGGTGAATFTDGGVLLGSGTGAITATAVLGDGVILIGDASGDPTTLDVGSSTAITILGTVATGVWNGTAVANAYVADDLTISGGTVNNSVIGGSTPAAGTFTQVDITAEGDLRLQDNTGGQYVGFDAPATVSGSYTLTLPAAIGAVDQVLSINNTDGTLQWATPETGDITSVVAGAGMTGGGTAGDVTLNVIGTADKITVNANDVTIASTYVGQTSITTLGTVATGVWNGTAVTVPYGGTGATSLTDGGVLLGSGTGAVTAMSVLADSEMIVGDGSTDPVAESGSTLRTSIGCDSASNITSGTLANARLPTNIDVGGTLDVTGATKLDGALEVSGHTFLDGTVSIGYPNPGTINQMLIGGPYTSPGLSTYAQVVQMSTALTGVTGDTAWLVGMRLSPSITTQASETIAHVASVEIAEPEITKGSGATVTRASTLWIRNAPTEGTNNYALYAGGDVTVTGSLSKTSGSFLIDHPLPSMSDHSLIHSFIEGPKADLIYRGTVTLVDGTAEVDLDEAAGMSSGTWVLLCRDEQCFTSNETGWFHVRGSVTGSTLTIDCEESDCTDTVSWMVVACRKDQHMYDTEWTDDDGYPIIEPLKLAPDPEPEP